MIYGFNDVKETINLLDFFYPVGSIYETADANFDPNTVWGGTWEQITGKFLLASDGTHSTGTTGGAASVNYTPAGTVAGHTLTINEMPKHSHTQSIHSYSSDNGYLSESGSGVASNYVSDALEGQTSQTGGGASHNHGFTGTQATIATMPPYEAVNVWKRTL